MKYNLDNIKELPSRSHPFFLAPVRKIDLELSSGNPRNRILFYREMGTGAPILLLHGLWTTAYTFRYVLGEISKSNRVIVLEMFHPEENGRPPRDDYRPEYLKELYSSLCRSLGLVRPLLVAQAESGLGALLLAMEQPETLLGVITVDTCLHLTFGARLRGKWMQVNWLRNRWAKKNFAQPQQAACFMLGDDNPTDTSRQEIRQLAYRWSNFPQAQATSKILAQTLSPTYHQTFLQKLTQCLSSPEGFIVPVKILSGRSFGRLPRKIRENLSKPDKNIEVIDSPRLCGHLEVEASNRLCTLIASMIRS